MADPQRLIDDPGGSALGRSLIASAHADAPSPEGRARAARRLGIAAVLVAGAGAGTEATAIAAAWKLAAVLLALGSAVGLAVWQSPADPLEDRVAPVVARPSRPMPGGGADQPDGAELPSHAAAAPSAQLAPAAPPPAMPLAAASGVAPRAPSGKPARGVPATARPARVVVTAPVAPVEAPAAPAPELAPPPEVEPTPEVAAPLVEPAPPVEPAPVAPPAAAPPIAGPSRLAAEVALVDRARSQLGGGNYPAALAALAEYHQRFPSGDLDAEAEVVTIETLIAARELARARALGTAFFARFPRSPLAQRVRSLLDRIPDRIPDPLPSPVRTPN
jgi:hypothetical protein